jgi:hypothetical protein
MLRPLIAALVAVAAGSGAALSQLALPGAVAPSAAGSVVKPYIPKASAARAGPRAVPGAASIVGRTLLLNGAAGQLQFSVKGAALRVEKFKLLGEAISNASQQCSVDVVGAAPIETKSLARPDGLARYEADIPACPLTFDILDGAIISPAQTDACVFRQADCQASPAGLWGPSGADLARDTKAVERARGRAETDMVDNFKELQARLKDPAHAKDFAREQAGFSSLREEECRDYAQESAYGYCATKMTEARAAYLRARSDELPPVVAAKTR